MRTREIVVDIETNGLISYANNQYPTVIHCIVAHDLHSNETFEYHGDTLKDFKALADTCKTFIGHNITFYDAPVLRKLLGVEFPPCSLRDTLVMSRMYDPHLKGGHSLASWGERFKFPKIDFNEWDTFTPEMLTYCKQDVALNVRVYKWLMMRGLKDFSSFSINLENETNEAIEEISRVGMPINIEKVLALLESSTTEFDRLADNFDKVFPPEKTFIRNKVPRYNKMGEMYTQDARLIEGGHCELQDDGSYNVYSYVPFNPLSSQQVLKKLDGSGWKPRARTASGDNWKVNAENLETLPDSAPQALKDLATYRILKSRIDAIKGWVNGYSETTGHIHPRITCPGASTHRMSHTNPQTGNIPAGRSFLGREMRECFGPQDPDYKLVGMDFANIQLSVLAHYMEDDTYITALETGTKEELTDIHNVNMRLAGLASRDLAKKFIYSLLLNASDFRLAEDQGCSKAEAKASRDRLMNAIPAFNKVDKYCNVIAGQGCHVALDGRRVNVPSKHLALATVLQSEESIVMRLVICLLRRRIKELGLRARIGLIVHDELQAIVHKDDVEAYSREALAIVTKAGELLKYKCKLFGEINVGDNWYETH